MGLFCVNMHFRSTDDKALSSAVRGLGVSQFRVLPAKGGWTSLYEEEASHQDDGRIRDLMEGLTRDLKVAAVAFMVHDSDIACYWLYENGEPLDEYNSCPAYFDDDATGDEPPSGGRPDVLVRYCRNGVTEEQIAAALGGESVFAEGVIEELAGALGIDVERALADYRDGGDGFGGDNDDEDNGDDDDGDDGDGPQHLSIRQGMTARLTEMLGSDPRAAANPQATALVAAAVKGDVAEIDRLLATGVAPDVEAPGDLPGQPMAAMAQLFAGKRPQMPMTPLIAAVSHKQRAAAVRLLERGADPNHVHHVFGTAIHAAAGGGEVDMLKLLIERGGDVNAQNAHKLTPLHVIRQARATTERLAQAQEMMKSMGMKVPGLVDQLATTVLPTEGWDACERLLKEQGAA